MNDFRNVFSLMANAIREKNGASNKYFAYDFPSAISELPSFNINDYSIIVNDGGVIRNDVFKMNNYYTAVINDNIARTFNNDIIIGSNIKKLCYTFGNSIQYNRPLTIPSSVKAVSNLFTSSSIFNSTFKFTNYTNNMCDALSDCINFNQPITIPEYKKDDNALLINMFKNCRSFNQPLIFNNCKYINNMYMMLYNCQNFNQPVIFNNCENIGSINYMFGNCRNFNQSILFNNCKNFENLVYMFYACFNFNQSVSFDNCKNFGNMAFMFYDCRIFNRPITIPEGVTSTSYMFYNCQNFNQPITIPNSVTNTANMFNYCYNMSSNIYIKSNANAKYILGARRSYFKRINIFYQNISNTSTIPTFSTTAVSYKPMINGFYNSLYNIYIYNNQ